MSVVPRPRFEFSFLRNVIPIGASSELEGRMLVLYSLERYEHGFIAVLGLEVTEWDTAGTLTVINARDDLGNRYIGQTQAGYGGGSPTGSHRDRIVMGFSPELRPDATALTFECTDVRSRPDSPVGFVEGIGHVYRQDAVVGSPWEATIPLIEMTNDHTPAVPDEEQPLPEHDFASLIRVVPIGQQQVIRHVGLTVLSLELYRDSFLTNVRIECPGQVNALFPRQGWAASDDTGNRYRCYDQPGSGLLVPNGSAARMAYFFRPALKPGATRLQLTYTHIDLTFRSYIPTQYQSDVRDGCVTITGPWVFDINVRRSS